MSKAEDKIVQEAKDRFKRAENWESEFRRNFISDYKFYNGDSNNMWQWEDNNSQGRIQDGRPALTINKTRQHVKQIVNDAMQNKAQIRITPTGDGGTFEAAQIFEGIVRHIEYQSNAQDAYTNAFDGQVAAGIGWWRIVTDYPHDNTFDQEIYIKRVGDPLSIYLDPDIQEADGSDAKWGFVFNDMPKDEFDAEYPEYKDQYPNASPLGTASDYGNNDGWNTKDHIRVAEYFRVVYEDDKLHLLSDGTQVKASEIDDKDFLKQNSIKSRDIQSPKIEHYIIAGSEIIEKKEWPGKYIPLVRVIGEETVINKEMDRKGHVRSLIDPQRMYNWYSSQAVEAVALQTKTPWLGSVEAIEGYEEQYANSNVINAALLPYNQYNENGTKNDRPERSPGIEMNPAYVEGLKITAEEMKMVSGQYDASVGARSNEVSGTAIEARQRQGDTATYHYINRQAQSIRYTGRILIDLIPKIYDTPRIIKILGEDGTQTSVQIDPGLQAPQPQMGMAMGMGQANVNSQAQAPQVQPGQPIAHQQIQDPDSDDYDPEQIAHIFNPNVGRYEVESDVGPSFATKRQEAFDAMMKLAEGDKNLMPIIGDIILKNADFPGSQEAAERLHNVVPPAALGNKQPDPALVQAQQHIQQLQQMLAQQHQQMMNAMQKQQDVQSKLNDQALQKDIDWYRAETDRMKAVATIDPAAMMPIIRQMVSDVLGTPVNPLIAAHAAANAQMAQAPQAPPHPIVADQNQQKLNQSQQGLDLQAQAQQNAQNNPPNNNNTGE